MIKNDTNIIGFIYRIDYKGSNEILQGMSYAGSKKISSKINWEKYFGSPSNKNCAKCAAWKIESKLNPNDFEKKIVKYVYENESIIQSEIEYLKKVSSNIIKDEKWLNTSIPRINAFPEYTFTKEEMHERELKRKNTLIEKYGSEHGHLNNMENRKKFLLKKYGVDHFNKLESSKLAVSKHRKLYFQNLTEEEKRLHGQKSLRNRNYENVLKGAKKCTETKKNFSIERKIEIQNKRKSNWYKSLKERSPSKIKEISEKLSYIGKLSQKQLYVTMEFLDNNKIESKFILDWINDGFARDGISDRIKNNSLKPLFSRTTKKWIRIISHKKISRLDLMNEV